MSEHGIRMSEAFVLANIFCIISYDITDYFGQIDARFEFYYKLISLKMKKVLIIFALLFILILNLVSAQKQRFDLIDSLHHSMQVAKTDTDRLKFLYRIGDAYASTNPDTSLIIAKSGLLQCEKINWKKGIASFHISIGNILSDKGYYDSAIYHFNIAYNTYKEIEYLKGEYSALINIGTTYQRRGQDKQALEYYLQAMPLIEKANDKYNLSINNINIAGVYNNEDNFSKSLQYSLKGLEIAKEENNLNHQALALKTIANGYLINKDTLQARKYLLSSLDLYKKNEDKVGEATDYYELAAIETDIVKSIRYSLQSKKIWDEINPNYPIAVANLCEIAKTYILLSKNKTTQQELLKQNIITNSHEQLLDTAESYLNNAVTLSKQSDDESTLTIALKQLSDLYEAKGNYKLAMRYLQESSTINDSLYSQESKNKIAELEANYQFDKKEITYKSQQATARQHIKQLWTYAILALAIVVALCIYLIYRNRLKQLQLKHEKQQHIAERKQKELIYQNQLTQSELKAMRAQMNPHFIFNVLNSIESYVVENDSKTASRLIQKFATLCRLILENTTQPLVNIEREWNALKLYTEFEALRFPKRFTYSFEIENNVSFSTLQIPPMMVQPLIENSIHHGLRNSDRNDLFLNVQALLETDSIKFIISDNGLGLQKKKIEERENQHFLTKRKSLGIAMIKERIEIINQSLDKKIASFSLMEKDNQTIAMLVVPVYR